MYISCLDIGLYHTPVKDKILAVRHHYENVVNYILTARIKVSGAGGIFVGAAGTVGSALEQGISRGRVDSGESLLSGAGNALSEVLYGTGPIKGVKDAFLRGARTGEVMSGLENLTGHVGSYGVAGERIFGKKADRAVIPTNAGRDPKGMCGAADPFDLSGGLGNGRGYRSGAGHDSGTGGFSLGGFVRDVLTGAVAGGLGSAGFYGAGKAVDVLRGSVAGRGNSVETPYGMAVQNNSKEARRIKKYVKQGGRVYRGGTYGRSKIADAQFGAPESPLTVGYAKKYGVDFGQMDYIIGGYVKKETKFITRPAPGLGSNSGGAIEIVTPPNSVELQYFYMLGE